MRARIEDRLRRAVRADRIHRMRRVAHQRDRTKRPARQRIAIDQRILVGMRAIADQARHVEPVEAPVLEPGQELLELRRAVIVLAPPLIVRIERALGDPVDLRPAVRQRARDRIADELHVLMAGHDHGAAGEKRVAFGDAAPEDAAVPDRRTFVRDRAFRARPNGCRRLRSARRRHGCRHSCRSPCRGSWRGCPIPSP